MLKINNLVWHLIQLCLNGHHWLPAWYHQMAKGDKQHTTVFLCQCLLSYVGKTPCHFMGKFVQASNLKRKGWNATGGRDYTKHKTYKVVSRARVKKSKWKGEVQKTKDPKHKGKPERLVWRHQNWREKQQRQEAELSTWGELQNKTGNTKQDHKTTTPLPKRQKCQVM